MKINHLIYFSCTIGHSVQWNKNFIERSLFLSHTLLIVLYTTYFSLHVNREGCTVELCYQTQPTAFSTGQRHSCIFSSLKNHLTYSMYSLIFIQPLNLSSHFLPPPTPPSAPHSLGVGGHPELLWTDLVCWLVEVEPPSLKPLQVCTICTQATVAQPCNLF